MSCSPAVTVGMGCPRAVGRGNTRITWLPDALTPAPSPHRDRRSLGEGEQLVGSAHTGHHPLPAGGEGDGGWGQSPDYSTRPGAPAYYSSGGITVTKCPSPIITGSPPSTGTSHT